MQAFIPGASPPDVNTAIFFILTFVDLINCSNFNINGINSKMKNQIRHKDISFFEKVYQVTRLIPKGKVTSYGAIAKYLGAARSARMVGWAMNNAHAIKPHVPAQRVVNRVGLLTGKHHFGTQNMMQKLLENEGIKIKEDKIQDFEKHFWDPTKELL